jgi:DNA polymerase III subunit epsilon
MLDGSIVPPQGLYWTVEKGYIVKHRPLVFLDIETTGLTAQYARVTEIGALRVEEGRVVAKFKQLINPEMHIPPFITRLTGITNEMLWEAPTFRAIADDLELFLDGALFIAHNVDFDYSFIKAEFERINYRFKMDRMCSAKLSRRLYPEHKSHALDRIIERMQLDVVNRHRAYDDAEVLWKFYAAELKKRQLDLFLHMNKLTTFAR